jgi:hypothetical protein
MKRLKDIIKCIVFLLSIMIVVASREVFKTNATDISFLIYPLILLGSVGFIHWFVWHHFMPFSELSEEFKKELLEQSQISYRKSFFAGCNGLGYFLVLISISTYMISYSDKSIGDMPVNFPIYGVVLIMIGILVKTHGLLRYLIKEKLEQRKSSD